ncbi:uncharacterized protein LOC124166468 [Ischnura elegans]|uniref:uncharacterized protein LOC124166468 n=1 Tax=Ischnura elegans TaxID=197161 RepID=UPI001ED86E73|nr:uncharacterized protein LOC124166468 [Ischnura elegans]
MASGTPLRVALFLSALLAYLSMPEDATGLGMWGDFSRRSQGAQGGDDGGVGAWVDDDLSPFDSEVNRSAQVIEEKVKIRRRRYVTFPEGSSSSLAICLSLGVSDTNLIFTHGLGYGISFELPNDTKSLRGEGKAKGDEASRELRSLDLDNDFPAKRRDRRTLYRRIEEALKAFGLNGKACILHTLCEAAQRLAPKGGLMQEFLRIIFSMPQLDKPHSWDGWDWNAESSTEYDKAHLHGRDNPDDNCAFYFPGCDISLLDYLI